MYRQQLREYIKTFHHEKSGKSVIAVLNKASYGWVILIAETTLKMKCFSNKE